MVDKLDRAIGRIIATLEEEQMMESTLIWFISDNGGLNPAVPTRKPRIAIPGCFPQESTALKLWRDPLLRRIE